MGIDQQALLNVKTNRVLLHPMWWGSLTLLVLNDHVFKGAGLLPTWLTGKLSDVAGLIVAPVLLCVLVGARRPLSRLICFFAVASVFAGQNLSEQVATVLVDVVSVVGIRWTIVTDPSDLLALVSLPLAWWLVNEGGVRLGPARPMVRRAFLFVGAWACVATSVPGEDVSSEDDSNVRHVFVCGNGHVEADEECDDGNHVNGDGCSNLCMEEQPNFTGGAGGYGGSGGGA